MRRATDSVLLAWARDAAGRRVAVSDLDPRRRRDRGPFTCLGCGETLTPRLGAVRARHFAHRPGSACPLTAPESALHLDVKERLVRLCREAFAGRRRVLLGARCPGCRRPAPLDVSALGDAADAEGALGGLRADVLVSRGGIASLALEVRVAHALEASKEDRLAALGVPALEVDARAEWEAEEDGATLVRCARSSGFPPCGACQARARADEDRSRGGEDAAVGELESYRARGLLGPPPGPARPDAARLSDGERRAVAAAFRCPDCGGAQILAGERLLRHACPGEAPRPLAWRGYDGALVELAWWRRGGRP